MVDKVNATTAVTSVQRRNIAVGRGGDFRRALDEATRRTGEVRLSAHAEERLRQRNIDLSSADMARIGKAVERLAAKGGREALVVMDSVGLILDVKNRTVITAIERGNLQENVFTNIDSAAFA